MRLHPPFAISARLLPAVKIADGWLSLIETMPGDEGRVRASLVLDLPCGFEHYDTGLQSGCGGFRNHVEIFETYLAFLDSAVESHEFNERHPEHRDDDPPSFPAQVIEWAANNHCELECVRCDLCDEDGDVRPELIEVNA